MKQRIISSLGLSVLAGVSLVTPALAVVSIDYAFVGNVNNAADSTGYGAVGYAYKIAKNETTIGQYAAFLNAVAKTDTYSLYSTSMTTSAIAGITRGGSAGGYTYAPVAGSENKPITYVSWFDAARFCNWLHNGQPSGAQNASTTEDGAYTLLGAMSDVSVFKNAAAKVWIPSENEWYKAAYYDATKDGTGGYWAYPTQSNSMTTNDLGVAGAANYKDASGYATYVGGTSSGITDVGAYGANSDSFYGTNDQGGNVWEWNDAVTSGSWRGLRGGSWDLYGSYYLSSSSRGNNLPSDEYAGAGFRVASVPEPSCVVLTLLASGMLVTRRKR
ncbi:MAG: SUMF1/EgtB/PvdO family nonheme iron enzyme [Verrucomicrobia bacterium]|nr:SUMF1/EgtB/PvdO family nonheme iron enzyme [Verrucomicrobiota bacterium]